ncbi:MAG: F0F1 ATP synthase subunit gamma [Candidatus Omnitrophica bacterium]|nr:F0F1 ATP synthase subunit gamma [Candidatus Omnitrophota bacterium]
MEALQKIKEESHLNIYMTELMEILKGIAISEFWTLAKKQGRFARFMKAFNGFFDIVDFHQVQHPLATEQGKLAIFMVTSNEGFMGGLNTRVISAALANPEAGEAELIILGEQGASYLVAMGRRFVSFPGVGSEECYDAAIQLRNYIIKESQKGTFGRLTVYSPKSVSFMVQKVEEFKMLPCAELFQKKEKVAALKEEWIIESSLQNMIQYLVETWIAQKLYELLEDSKLAEFSARTVHLEESSQLLQERGKGIHSRYLRSWHELIDKGMRDTFSAQIIRRKARRAMQKV